MADTKTYTENYNLEKPGQDDFYNVDVFNANADKIDAEMKAADARDTTHKNAATLDHPDNSVTDAKIGNRTITDTVTAAARADTPTNLWSKLGNMIKQITGKTTWWTPPATTLEAAKAHADAVNNPHNVTAAQVGAETPAGAQAKATAAQTAANNYTDTKTANLINNTDYRLTDARPANGGMANEMYDYAYGGVHRIRSVNKNTAISGESNSELMLWNETGYFRIRAGLADYADSAGSVPWSAVTDKPPGTSVWISGEYTPVKSTITIATHNLGINPLYARAEVLLKCVIAEQGYAAGDYALGWAPNGGGSIIMPSPVISANAVTVSTGNGGTGLALLTTAGVYTSATLANWRYVFRIWY